MSVPVRDRPIPIVSEPDTDSHGSKPTDANATSHGSVKLQIREAERFRPTQRRLLLVETKFSVAVAPKGNFTYNQHLNHNLKCDSCLSGSFRMSDGLMAPRGHDFIFFSSTWWIATSTPPTLVDIASSSTSCRVCSRRQTCHPLNHLFFVESISKFLLFTILS